MKAKWFWFYADGKRVKELSWEEWRDIVNRDRHASMDVGRHLLVRIDDSHIYARKGSDSIWIRKSQLKEVIE